MSILGRFQIALASILGFRGYFQISTVSLRESMFSYFWIPFPVFKDIPFFCRYDNNIQ